MHPKQRQRERGCKPSISASRIQHAVWLSALLIGLFVPNSVSARVTGYTISVNHFISGHKFDQCKADLAEADTNGDGKLNDDEYLEFVNIQSGGRINVDRMWNLPLNLVMLFVYTSCKCAYMEPFVEESECCVKDNAYIKAMDNGEPECETYLVEFCSDITIYLDEVLPPTPRPTVAPDTLQPSPRPSTEAPSSVAPTISPTAYPTVSPTDHPTTASPILAPATLRPTASPTRSPSTISPTLSPVEAPVTPIPTTSPTPPPSTPIPSVFMFPSTISPTLSPIEAPVTPTPTTVPTPPPSAPIPSVSPTHRPTTHMPTSVPTPSPSASPTPTLAPATLRPTASPTMPPSTISPTLSPVEAPVTPIPTTSPTPPPSTHIPSVSPTHRPTTHTPTSAPTPSPSASPTDTPTFLPTLVPSPGPVLPPTSAPIAPTLEPTASPTVQGQIGISIVYGVTNSKGLDADAVMNEVNNTLKCGLVSATRSIVIDTLNATFPKAMKKADTTFTKAMPPKAELILVKEMNDRRSRSSESRHSVSERSKRGNGRVGRNLEVSRGTTNAQSLLLAVQDGRISPAVFMQRAVNMGMIQRAGANLPKLTSHSDEESTTIDLPKRILLPEHSRRLVYYTDEVPVVITSILDNPSCPSTRNENINCLIVFSTVYVILEENDDEVAVREAVLSGMRESFEDGSFLETIPDPCFYVDER